MTNERALLDRARAYDEDALGQLYDQYAHLIYSYLYRRVHNAQMAEDLTGEVFVRVLQAIRSEQFWHTSFRAWLYRIAHNLVIDHYRRQQPLPPLELDEQRLPADDNPIEKLETRLSYRYLWAAIRQLTPDQQHVLTLRFGEELKAREVADILGKSVGAVEALQHRALNALRRILEEESER